MNMRQPSPLELRLDPDAVASLACACLYRGWVKDYSGLVILVPLSYTYLSESYLRYCRSIMLRIASCVPYGLRRYLSFATNPDSNGIDDRWGYRLRPGVAKAARCQNTVCIRIWSR